MIHDFPWTDMHELNLDWFLAEFKKYYEKVIEQDQKITTLEETVEQFTSFVTNYFDNLDVQQEINNKLDALVADGTMSALLEPIFNEYAAYITNRVDSQDTAISVLEGRMDAFASLSEGSTTGDAELMDIRVGANGITYPSAGDAVRACDDINHNQIIALSDIQTNYETDILIKSGKNLWDGTVITGYALDTDGTMYASAGYKIGKCKIEYGHKYKMYIKGSTMYSNANTRYGFYDISGNYISGGVASIVTNSSNADYLYFNLGTDTYNSDKMWVMDKDSIKPVTDSEYESSTQIFHANYTTTSALNKLRNSYGLSDTIRILHSNASSIVTKTDGKLSYEYELSSGYFFPFYVIDVDSVRNKEIILNFMNRSASTISFDIFATDDTWSPTSKYTNIGRKYVDAGKSEIYKFTLSGNVLTAAGDIRIGIRDVAYNSGVTVKYTASVTFSPELSNTIIEKSMIARKSLYSFLADTAKNVSAWVDKKWTAYGDSIVGISNGDGLDLGWAKYVNDKYLFDAFYGRGVGGQSYAWGSAGGSVTFINSTDGTYYNRNDSYNKDNYTGEIPAGTVACRGCMCSWDRITHMYPASIKDNIDLIFIMAGTNDSYSNTDPTFIDNDTTDPEWAASTYYSTYNGDYNIATLNGGLASTIMKMQAWMPQAIIVIGTPLSGRGITGQIGTDVNNVSELPKAVTIKNTAMKFSLPCIDIYGTCGINPLNRTTYISDSVHPYNDDGKKMLARSIIGGLNIIMPNIE